MGHWDCGVINSDTAWDAVSVLEKLTSYKSEKYPFETLLGTSHSTIDGARNRQFKKAKAAVAAVRPKIWNLLKKWNAKLKKMNEEIIAVVYFLIELEIKLPKEIEKIARAAVKVDAWGTDSHERREALADFIARLDAATGKGPALRNYVVTLRRVEESTVDVRVSAVSAYDAKLMVDSRIESEASRFKWVNTRSQARVEDVTETFE